MTRRPVTAAAGGVDRGTDAPEDGGLVSRGWVLDSREQVEALVAELTERFGEPHHEGTLDRIGFAHVMGAVQVNAVIT